MFQTEVPSHRPMKLVDFDIWPHPLCCPAMLQPAIMSSMFSEPIRALTLTLIPQ